MKNIIKKTIGYLLLLSPLVFILILLVNTGVGLAEALGAIAMALGALGLFCLGLILALYD